MLEQLAPESRSALVELIAAEVVGIHELIVQRLRESDRLTEEDVAEIAALEAFARAGIDRLRAFLREGVDVAAD